MKDNSPTHNFTQMEPTEQPGMLGSYTQDIRMTKDHNPMSKINMIKQHQYSKIQNGYDFQSHGAQSHQSSLIPCGYIPAGQSTLYIN